MKKLITIIMLISAIFICPLSVNAQGKNTTITKINSLVLKHYINGIQYVDANALGADAVPYLLEMLSNPNLKEYWVNIIVTLGFIESSTAFDHLKSFLENTQGEVDDHTFRALLSVPFAIGCIASNGDDRALRFLIDKLNAPSNVQLPWRYKGKKVDQLLAEQSVIGLAISGRPEARAELLKMKKQIESDLPDRKFLISTIGDGLKIMDRIQTQGRRYIFNPRQEN